jgi:hypothetical protein
MAGRVIRPVLGAEDGSRKGGMMANVSYATDISPLFRTFDIESMQPTGLDLSSYAAVKQKAEAIYRVLAAKKMPCDNPWSESKTQKIKDWIDGGMLP